MFIFPILIYFDIFFTNFFNVYFSNSRQKTGTDVFKALALGAKAVFIGRPVLFGLAVDGQTGVENVLKILQKEFDTAMALAGVTKVSEIDEKFIAHESTFRLSKL